MTNTTAALKPITGSIISLVAMATLPHTTTTRDSVHKALI